MPRSLDIATRGAPAAKAREAIRLLAPFSDPGFAEQVAGCPDLEGELIEAHGHASVLDRLVREHGA